MRLLQNAGERFFRPIRIVGGPMSRGTIIRPSDSRDPGPEFALPRLTLRVRRDSLINAGQVILAEGQHYIVGAHSQFEDYRNHNIFPADRQVAWTRTTRVLDPITKQQIESSPQSMGQIWVVWQRERRDYADLPIRFNQDTTLTLTAADVRLDDFLDGIRVSRLSNSMGIRVLELQA